MASKKNLIFVGLIKELPDCGISMKNFFLQKKFREYYEKIDTVCINKADGKLSYFLSVIRVIFLSICNRKSKIVISANTGDAYALVKALVLFGMADRCYYWAPGGVFHILVRKKYDKYFFMRIKKIYVQSLVMVEELKRIGFRNTMCVPNCKKVYRDIDVRCRKKGLVNFVYLSRIHPLKGCRLIMECAERLNEMGYGKSFNVDFWGNIFPDYREEFVSCCNKISNVHYKGYIDLMGKQGYEKLSSYDMMLFPTFWWGEGFPGIIIDSYISGVPIIASDWNFNSEVVDSDTGIIIEAQNADELLKSMKAVIDGEYDLNKLSQECKKRALSYDIENVLSKSNLQKMELI